MFTTKSDADISYNRLLPSHEDEREYLNLEELKPHQLTDLGILSQSGPGPIDGQLPHCSPDSMSAAKAADAQEPSIYRSQPLFHHHHHHHNSHHHHHHQIIQQVHLQHQQTFVQRLTAQPHQHAEPEPIYYDLSSQNLSE